MTADFARGLITEHRLRRELTALGVEPGATLIVHFSMSAIGWVLGGAPLFDRRTTPTSMGIIPETFRNWPVTLRSGHPLESACARGPHAEGITREHPLAFSEGPGSPFAELYELDSRILLVGVGFNRCTALHHAESLTSRRRTMTVRFPRCGDPASGPREWVEVPNVADDLGTHFPRIGAQFEKTGRAARGPLGAADCLYFRMRELVDFARDYFERTL